MYTARISSKYQVVIPRSSQAIRLEAGAEDRLHTLQQDPACYYFPPIEQALGMLKGMNTESYREEEDEERP